MVVVAFPNNNSPSGFRWLAVLGVSVAVGYCIVLHQSLEIALLQCHRKVELTITEARPREL